MIRNEIGLFKEVVEAVVHKLTVTEITLTATHAKIYTCNTLYLNPGKIITITGVRYRVTSFLINEWIEVKPVKGTTLPATNITEITIPNPKFYDGTPKRAQIENLNDKNVADYQGPIIWLLMWLEIKGPEDKRTSYIRSTIEGANLFFLDDCEPADWNQEDHRINVWQPMENELDHIFRALEARPDIFSRDIQRPDIRPHSNFGTYLTNKGYENTILTGAWSGIQAILDIPYIIDPCGCSEVTVCGPVRVVMNEVAVDEIPANSDYNLTIVDTNGDDPLESYDDVTKTAVVAAAGGSTPVDITVNQTLVFNQITTDQTLENVNTDDEQIGSLVAGKWVNPDVTHDFQGNNISPTPAGQNMNIQVLDQDDENAGTLETDDPNSVVIRVNVAKYDPSAQALFDRILELEPVYGVAEAFKPIINAFIVACKSSGKWYEEQFWVVTYVPTLNVFATLIEIKSLTIQSTFADTSAMVPPYNIALRVGTTSSGFAFRSTGYLNMGFIPSSKMLLNNSCAGIMTYADETGVATFNFGALVSTTQTTAFSKKLNTNAMVADMYGTTVGTGRVSVASATGAKGWAYGNRIGTAAEIVENSVTVGSHTGSQGTLPNITEFANTFNNAGTPSTRRLQSAIVMLFKMLGMTAPQKAIMHPALTAYQTDSKMKAGLETKQIILASNSHGVYWHGATQRMFDYLTYSQGWKITNVSISGRQTLNTIGIATGLIPTYATVVAPLYNAALAENWVYLDEGTNDLWFNGNLASAKQNYIDYVALCHGTGFLVKTRPIKCRKFTGNPGGRTETEFNNDINDFNVWLLGGGSGADVVAQINPNTFVLKGSMSDAAYNAACAAIYTNATYFYDAATIGTHLVEAEYFVEAQQTFLA